MIKERSNTRRSRQRHIYFKNHPWARFLRNSKNAAKKKKQSFLLSAEILKRMWERDGGWLMKNPHLVRINLDHGYNELNCKYVEENDPLYLRTT